MKIRLHFAFICGTVALALLWTPCFAQQAKDSSYQSIADNFFKMLQEGKGPEAVDYMFDTNPELKKRIPDQTENLKTQFSSIGALMGAYVSHTKLAETKVAGMFVYQHYFVAYERQPISIRIKYYKPGTTWVLYGLQFDAELADLVQKTTDNNLSLDISK